MRTPTKLVTSTTEDYELRDWTQFRLHVKVHVVSNLEK